MNEPKLATCIVGSVFAWAMTALAYFAAHLTQVAAFVAIIASIFTAMAAFEKWRLCRTQRKRLEEL